jgi:ABC-type sugar transport system substrate-binding protein
MGTGGRTGSLNFTDRGRGFRENVSDCGIEITRSQTGNWSASKGKVVTEAWLKETTNVQGVFAQNDEMGLGVIEAIKEAVLRPGVDIKIVSIGATRGAFIAMLEGVLNVTIEYNPYLAPQVYEAAMKALNGEELPKWIYSEEDIFRMGMPDLEEVVRGRFPKYF